MKTICIAGKNDIAVDVLLYCLRYYNDCKLLCVTNKNESGKNSWQKSLSWFADKYGVKVCSLDETYNISDLVFLSVEFDQIVSPDKFLSKDLYNIHFSLLPKYKGMYTSVLPILFGEKRTGVTLHKIRKGIDTGEIIDQQEILINKSDTSYDLYIKLIEVGTKIIIKNLNNILYGNVISFPQPIEESTYYSKTSINFSEIKLNLNATAYQIQNQIRAFSFRPYQLINWKKVYLIQCDILSQISEQKPGTIIEDAETYFIVSSIDYNVKLYKDVFQKMMDSIKNANNNIAKKLCSCEQIIKSKDDHGWSALSIAVQSNNLEMVDFLLQKNADINVVDNDGKNLLMFAKDIGIKTGDWRIFKILINNGLSVDLKDYFGKKVTDYLNKSYFEFIPVEIRKFLV